MVITSGNESASEDDLDEPSADASTPAAISDGRPLIICSLVIGSGLLHILPRLFMFTEHTKIV